MLRILHKSSAAIEARLSLLTIKRLTLEETKQSNSWNEEGEE